MSDDILLEYVGPGAELPGFDIDDPELPKRIADRALTSSGFPYTETMKRKAYRAELQPLRVELFKLQRWVATRPDSKVVGSSPEFFATA
ncbi:MAG: hypothetical protein ACXWJ4_00830 [Methyloceanibacter sp.]